MATSSSSRPIRVGQGQRIARIAQQVRSLTPRRSGRVVLVALTLAAYLLRAALVYPVVLLDTPMLAQALVAQAVGATVLGFVFLLVSGGLLVVVSLVLPLYADVCSFSPALIQAGTQEVIVSDAMRMVDRLRAAGVPVKFEVWPGMYRAFYRRRLYPRGTPRRTACHRVHALIFDLKG